MGPIPLELRRISPTRDPDGAGRAWSCVFHPLEGPDRRPITVMLRTGDLRSWSALCHGLRRALGPFYSPRPGSPNTLKIPDGCPHGLLGEAWDGDPAEGTADSAAFAGHEVSDQPRDEHGRWTATGATAAVHEHLTSLGGVPRSVQELSRNLKLTRDQTSSALRDLYHSGHVVDGPVRPSGTPTYRASGKPLTTTTTPTPQAAPAPATPSTPAPPPQVAHPAAEKLRQALDTLPPRDRASMAHAVEHVTGRMNPKCLDRIKENVRKVGYHESSIEMGVALERLDPTIAKTTGGAHLSAGGCFLGNHNELHVVSGYLGRGGLTGPLLKLDDASADRHVLAHELGHAIDGPAYLYTRDKEWVVPWLMEIGGSGWMAKIASKASRQVNLSEYAKSSAQEGFAEFCRLLHAGDVPMSEIEKNFPKCTAYWRAKGLLPAGSAGTAQHSAADEGQGTLLPEIFTQGLALPDGTCVDGLGSAGQEEQAPMSAERKAELLGLTTLGRQTLATVTFAGDGDCRWVTIGGTEGDDGKRHGGSPVCIKDGRIVKGAPSLTGRSIDALKEEPDYGTHRQQLARSKEYERATWAKRAREEGYESAHLHQLAAEIQAHDQELTAGRTHLVRRARELLAHYGYDARALTTNLRSGRVEDKIPALDVVADSLSRTHPEHFHGHEEDLEGRLRDLLTEGNPQPMSQDRVYAQALDVLRQTPPRSRGRQKHTSGDDDVPFER